MRLLPLLLTSLIIAAEPNPPKAPAPDAGHDALREMIYAYEPTYFAIDPGVGNGEPINAKFQISFAFRAVPVGNAGPGPLLPDGLYGAYSQTSFWDLEGPSKPFYDSSYKPEFWYHHRLLSGATDLGLEGGFGHESNGKSGLESRSFNHWFLRAPVAWRQDHLQAIVLPRARMYTQEEENPDIAHYRGYVDATAKLLWDTGPGLAVTLRPGSSLEAGSLMAEGTLPLGPLTGGHVQGYLYMQWFVGYSESLLAYDERSPQPRLLFGFAITR
jgi:outer membrane phospholipase A